ncbi:MAG: TOMM precursor leader peptide-binding protein, partial [Burkholderiaceae bacterium]|nr:TOMM precursor leader peptide-binding protein [Burkholderiaceae bacterium]
PALAPREVLGALEQLAGKGYVTARAAAQPASALAFWELMGADGAAALAGLADLTVSIDSVGALNPEPLAQTLAASGIRMVESGRLHIALTDDHLRPELLGMARRAAAAEAPLLLVKPTGATPSVGPLIDARHGSCLACLQFWVRTNHPVEALIARVHSAAGCHLPLAVSASSKQATYGLAAAIIAGMFALRQDKNPLAHALLTLDLATMESKRHAVVKRPQCPCCGEPELMRRQAEVFPEPQSVRDLLCRDGGYRRRDPVQTFEQYQHLISAVSGPIAYLHPMPRRHAGARKVYVAGYLVCPQEIPRGNGFDKICAGKGQTDEQARASALCEALERFSGVYQGDEASVRGSMNTLGERAIDFGALQNFSEWQYDNRDAINSLTDDRRKQVPLRFGPDTVIDWTPAWSLTSGKQHYVPLTYCFAEAPGAAGAAYGIHNPNGAAAGNCREEAILQGFLELVERDATAVWWYNQIDLPQIDLASFGDPYFDRLALDYAAIGWDLWVLDLTHDLGIPVCAALAHQRAERRYAIGFGCHLNGRLAVQRALTEVNQLFDPAGDSPAPWDRAKMNDTGFLFPSPERGQRRAADLSSVGGVDLQADIAHCVALLAARGMELLVVDKTRPDIGLNVVQAIVPGLRHFWPRFGAGRLYSVPRAMGWLAQPKAEHALNPAPLFL